MTGELYKKAEASGLLTASNKNSRICKNVQMRISAQPNLCLGRSARNAEDEMRQQLSDFKADFFKALAHPLRISILDALREGELTVNEISQRFDVEQANASQQLAVLRNRNIVVTRKDGANVYYSVSDKSIFKLLDAAKEIFNNHLVGLRSMLEEIHGRQPSKARRHQPSQRVR